MIIIFSVILYIILSLITYSLIRRDSFDSEFDYTIALLWPLLILALILLPIHICIDNFFNGRKYKKLLIFADKSNTITINTQIKGRK